MPPAGFEPVIPASERPQTHALDREAIDICTNTIIIIIIIGGGSSSSSINLQPPNDIYIYIYIYIYVVPHR